MRRNLLLALTLAAFPHCLLAQTEPIRKPQPPAIEQEVQPLPLATNRRSFFIPVTVERTGKEHVPVEVQLLLSTNGGKSWSTFARQNPDSKGFQFQAPADGLYWFASRTLDAQGRVKPSGDLVPELQIVIDSVQPKIKLEATASGPAEIKASWQVIDPNLTLESVRLEYQSGDAVQPAWQSVPLTGSQQVTGEGIVGSVEWSPSGSSRVIDLRLIATDRAGNVAADTRRVFLPRVAKMEPKIPEWPPRISAKPAAKEPPADPFSGQQFGESQPLDSGNATSSTPATKPEISRPGSIPWPEDGTPAPAEYPTTPAPQDKVATLPTEPLPSTTGETSGAVTDRVVARPSSTGGETPYIWPAKTATEPAPSTSDSFSPIPSEPNGSTPNSSSYPSSPTDFPAPEGERPAVTSSKSFSLDYDLDSVGPGGVRAVELWVTIDGGRTWEKWGEDEDKRSPFEIQVQSERTFGFSMVIVANNGLAGRSPEPGDEADIWVTVDSTQPRARLLQAAYGQGEHSGQLDIRWEADDPHLTARPITLSFAEMAEGPFTTLAAGLPNNGQYFWTIDPRTPRKLYLRLEVKDEAGNTAFDTTLEPVSLEGLSPKGRIRAISPGTPSPDAIQGAFRSPLFR